MRVLNETAPGMNAVDLDVDDEVSAEMRDDVAQHTDHRVASPREDVTAKGGRPRRGRRRHEVRRRDDVAQHTDHRVASPREDVTANGGRPRRGRRRHEVVARYVAVCAVELQPLAAFWAGIVAQVRNVM